MRPITISDFARFNKLLDSIRRARNGFEVNLEKFLLAELRYLKGQLKTLDGHLMVVPENRLIVSDEGYGFLPKTWEVV